MKEQFRAVQEGPSAFVLSSSGGNRSLWRDTYEKAVEDGAFAIVAFGWGGFSVEKIFVKNA